MTHSRTNLDVSSFLQLCAFYAMFFTFTHVNGQDRQEYIVYMGDLNPTSDIPTPILHSSFLEKTLNSSASLIHSYKSIFNGFVALLTNDEVHQISSMKEVVSIFPNKKNDMHTTRSWDFLKFPQNIIREKEVESNIIVGVIDSGIWPELNSFSDVGIGPPPDRWKGGCRGLRKFKCNNKIIGGRYYKTNDIFYELDVQSPRDTIGHGTHAASIIVGNTISSANFYGFRKGTTRGGVHSSRIAVYKVHWYDGIADTDIIRAFEDAINDGVDIISISLGRNINENYLKTSVSIGSFQAMRNGIMTVSSAGNYGPTHATVKNIYPWVLTVAASSTDQNFANYLRLGNRQTLLGFSLNTFDQTNFTTLVYAGTAPNISLGIPSTRSGISVRDKIVIYFKNDIGLGELALSNGAIGIVIVGKKDTFNEIYPTALPITFLYEKESDILLRYLETPGNLQTLSIMRSHEMFDRLAPYIPPFSSRGPNPITPEIFKPDLSAPGVRILAAWIPRISPSTVSRDTRRLSLYNIISGTSMACSHAAAAAAYVKSFHPSWSPAAIKSALMTTATEMSVRTTPTAEFGYEAGQINPASAINPGLVYDADITDYARFLCGKNFTNKQLSRVTGDEIACTRYGSKTDSLNLNMPSFSIPIVWANTHINLSLSRRVTNVGGKRSTYYAEILSPPTFKIRAVPSTLSFISVGQTQSFRLIVQGKMTSMKPVSASLSWICDTITVRSPIIIFGTMYGRE